MKTKIRNFIIALTATAFLTGCSDFLDIEDTTSINTTNYPETVDQCNSLLTSCYAGTHTVGLYAFYWYPMEMYLFDHSSDLFGAFDERANSAENNTIVSNRYTTQAYIDIFKLVNFANTTIAGVDHYRETAPATDNAALDYIKGQALFFRALAYWHGQIFFEIDEKNGLSLPFFDKPAASIDDMLKPRAKTGEMYQFMVNDLKESARLLTGHNDKERVGEWAVKGLLAKVYVQAGSDYWQDAKTVIEDIINHSGKTLASLTDYKRIFNGSPNEYEFGVESLYEINMITNPTQNGPWAGYTMGSGMPMVLSPCLVKLDVTGDINDPGTGENYTFPGGQTTTESGWINNYVHDANLRRFGFMGEDSVILTLNPAYDNTAEVTIDNYPFMVSTPNFKQKQLDLRANADPRLTVCAAQPWVDTTIDDKGRTTYYNRAGAIAGADLKDIQGWWHKKFMNLNGIENAALDKIHGKNYSSDANIPVIRLADIYLLYAEVMHNLGDDATALEYVNKVHRRAYGFDSNTASSVDYAGLNAPTKAVAGDKLATDVIKYERWAELFGEGQWWWDVRRWRLGENEVGVYKEVETGTTSLVFRGNGYYVQPIPQYELDRNKGIEQSEGYK
jgi:hypothetical protein